MKRSEMIERMTEEIVGEYNWDGKKVTIPLEYAYGIAENLLDTVEIKGMLPPKIIKSFDYIKDVAYSNVEVNEWELEDAE